MPSGGQQPRQQERGESERNGKGDSQTIEISFHNRGRADASTAHATAEHITHAPSSPCMQQDQEDQRQRYQQMQNSDETFKQRANLSRQWPLGPRDRKKYAEHVVLPHLSLVERSGGEVRPVPELDVPRVAGDLAAEWEADG